MKTKNDEWPDVVDVGEETLRGLCSLKWDLEGLDLEGLCFRPCGGRGNKLFI
jgi:hypothetical protein